MNPYNVSSALAVRKLVMSKCPNLCTDCIFSRSAYLNKGV